MQSDLCVANLEAPASEAGEPIRKCVPSLRARPDDLTLLRKAGLHTLPLANNHILDYEEQALLDTITAAEQCGLKTFGAGSDREQACSLLTLDGRRKSRNGTRACWSACS